MASLPIPAIGDKVYVDHADVANGTYFHGGVATVCDTWYERETPWIEVWETGQQLNWDYLSRSQEELKERFGESLAGEFWSGKPRPKNS